MKNNLLSDVKASYTLSDTLESTSVSTGDVIKVRLSRSKSDNSSFKGICISKKNKGNGHFNFTMRNLTSGDIVDVMFSSERTKTGQIEKDERVTKLFKRFLSNKSKHYNIKKSLLRRIAK